MGMFSRPRRMVAVAAACVAAAASFGPAGLAQAAAGPPVFQGLPWSIVGVGDLDRNGNADIVWHNANTNETQVWFMKDNVLQNKQIVRNEIGAPAIVGLPWSIVAIGDFDGGVEGASLKADIVWHNAATNETQIWFMNDHRIVRRSTVVDENGQPIFVGLPWSIVAAGDLNGSSSAPTARADIVWHNTNTNETQIWFMDNQHIEARATVVNETGQPTFVGLPWSIVGAGDFGHPSTTFIPKADIVWHNASTGETQVWFMGNNQIAQRSTVVDENGQPIFVGLPWSIVGVGDLDGPVPGAHLKADIVWHHANTNETQVWFMNGNRIVKRATVVSAV